MTTTLIGQQGFFWFFGVVEDIEDPKLLGRVRIRVFNEHEQNISTEELPWAQVMMPVTSESLQGIGDTPRLAVGCLCVGFFIDGAEKQLPVIMGTFPTIPELNDTKHSLSYLARGKQTLQKDRIGPEPPSSFNAEYPHNRVIHTRSGHAIELDDTPNHERIHIYHKSGSYIEINNEGRMVIKSASDSVEIVGADKTIFCKGDTNIKIEGNMTAEVKGSSYIVGGNSLTVAASKNITVLGADGISISSGKDIALSAPGGVTINEGSLTVVGAISSGVGVTASFTTPSGKTVHVQKGIITNVV